MILNPTDLSVLHFLSAVRSTLNVDSGSRRCFEDFLAICYDVTVDSMESLENFSGSADKGSDPKIVLLG